MLYCVISIYSTGTIEPGKTTVEGVWKESAEAFLEIAKLRSAYLSKIKDSYAECLDTSGHKWEISNGLETAELEYHVISTAACHL